MGVLQRFERRLGGLVEGTFARVFGGYVQPVEVAAALTREAQDKKAIVGAGRVLVPNAYVVELGEADLGRLAEYDEPLRAELAAMVSEAAVEQGWSFVGPVEVRLERADLDTGVFRVRSSVVAAPQPAPAAPQPAVAAPPALRHHPDAGDLTNAEDVGAPSYDGSGLAGPHLVVLGRGPAAAELARTVRLTGRTTVIGRGAEADVQLTDTGVSRRHAQVNLGEHPEVVDLGSTNGTRLNSRPVTRSPLVDGDRIGVGTSELVFRTSDVPPAGLA